ncbi:MAG: hypothetical protein NZT61_05640 [Deltaproteobacteria bacterium]|nr:hypothetical protein [Deltaproteobacteria bacterium]MCX7953464.1 hypothetical protein [Deltaproteobacteria bacterium]
MRVNLTLGQLIESLCVVAGVRNNKGKLGRVAQCLSSIFSRLSRSEKKRVKHILAKLSS